MWNKFCSAPGHRFHQNGLMRGLRGKDRDKDPEHVKNWEEKAWALNI